jgi:PAS domain S-box-containing protein
VSSINLVPSSKDLELLLARSEAEWRKLANTLPQIIWTCDAEGRLLWVNDRWMELTGLNEEESLNNKGALAAVHPDDLEEVQRRFAQALETSAPREMEYRIRTWGGVYRLHAARVVPVRNDEGAITRWVAAAVDVHDRREAERAVRASEARFDAVFQSNPQPMLVTRLALGTILNANDAFLELTEFSREELIGKSAVSLGVVSAEGRAAIVAPLRAEPSTEGELSLRTRSGRSLTLLVKSKKTEFDGELCLVSAVTDVTERRATEAALRRSEAIARARAQELETLMDAVPAAVWISRDPDCREVHGNRAGCELLRLHAGQNLSKTASDPTPTGHFKVFANDVEIRPEDLPLQRAARGIEMRNWEEEILFDDGQVIQLYGSAVPLRDPSGVVRGAIGAFVDVTRLKLAEAALREADRRKDEFLALLSHELRNPLAPILTAAQLMQMRGDVATPRERDVIVRQAQHLVRLVDDLLDVSRVARGKVALNRKVLELGGIVNKAIEAASSLFEQRRHELRLFVPAEGLLVDADEVRLTQVVSNLLTNAARYTPQGGHIEVTAERSGDRVILRVRDNGIGIDRGLLPSIFDLFVQGARGSAGGLGLGLSLVRTLTALHGGTVSAESEGLGAGSLFTVELPISTRAPAPLDAPARAAPSQATGIPVQRILIVDDNRDAAEMLAAVLAGAGHQVEIATDPSQALSLTDGFRPQIAILDIGLPVMDGYSLGRELRARLGEPAPILIALTGYGQEQDKRRSEEVGFAQHLVKPVDVESLVRLLDQLGRSH